MDTHTHTEISNEGNFISWFGGSFGGPNNHITCVKSLYGSRNTFDVRFSGQGLHTDDEEKDLSRAAGILKRSFSWLACFGRVSVIQ